MEGFQLRLGTICSPGDDEVSLLEGCLKDEELQASARVVAQ